MARVHVGGGVVRHRGHPWLHAQWAFTTKREAESKVSNQERWSQRYKRRDKYAIRPTQLTSGERKGQKVYLILSRGY